MNRTDRFFNYSRVIITSSCNYAACLLSIPFKLKDNVLKLLHLLACMTDLGTSNVNALQYMYSDLE